MPEPARLLGEHRFSAAATHPAGLLSQHPQILLSAPTTCSGTAYGAAFTPLGMPWFVLAPQEPIINRRANCASASRPLPPPAFPVLFLDNRIRREPPEGSIPPEPRPFRGSRSRQKSDAQEKRQNPDKPGQTRTNQQPGISRDMSRNQWLSKNKPVESQSQKFHKIRTNHTAPRKAFHRNRQLSRSGVCAVDGRLKQERRRPDGKSRTGNAEREKPNGRGCLSLLQCVESRQRDWIRRSRKFREKRGAVGFRGVLVDLEGFEPSTSSMPSK